MFLCYTRNVNHGMHLYLRIDTIKRNDILAGNPGKSHRPGIERGLFNFKSTRRGVRFPPAFPCECVFPDLPLSYCTYDEGSKFSGAISPKRRETIPRKDPRRRFRRPERRKECFPGRSAISGNEAERRLRMCQYSRNSERGPGVAFAIPLVLSSLQRSECPQT